MRRALLLGTVVAALAPSIAAAAPDERFELSPDMPKAAWSGGPYTAPAVPLLGVSPFFDEQCSWEVNPCHETLVHVTGPARFLFVDMTQTQGDQNDLDLVINRSDADGTRGEELANSFSGTDSPQHATVVDPAGYYLVSVIAWTAVHASFEATATLVLPAPAPPLGPPPAASVPAPALSARLHVARQRLRAARHRGLRVTLSCTVACRGQLALWAGRRRIGGVEVMGAGPQTVRLSRRARLRAPSRLVLTGVLVGPGGERVHLRRLVRLG